MKEHLHLFTPVTEALPEQTDCNYFCLYSSGLYRSGYFGHEARFSIGQHPGEVTHWLDLSKLTDKKTAGQKIIDAFTVTKCKDKNIEQFVKALIASL